MKIKIKKNTAINYQNLKSMENVDVEFGISTKLKIVDEKTWWIKCLKLINQNLISVTEEDQILFESTLENAQFLSKINAGEELEIQLNGSKFILDNLPQKIKCKFEQYLDKFGIFFNSDVSLYNSQDKKIILGENTIKYLRIDKNKKTNYDFIFMHEFSHYLDSTLIYSENNSKNDSLSIFLDIIKDIQLSILNKQKQEGTESTLEFIEKFFQKTKKFKSISFSDISDIKTLTKEMYADVSGLLLLREKNITLNKIDSNNNLANVVSYVRQAHRKFSKDKKLTSSVFHYNHFSTPAVEELEKIDLSLERGLIGFEEINKIARSNVNIGISKVLHTLINSDENFKSQLVNFFNLIKDDEFLNVLSDETKSKIQESFNFDSLIKSIEQNVGDDWLNTFNKNIEQIKNAEFIKIRASRNSQEIKDLIFNAGLYEEGFKKQFEELNKSISWFNDNTILKNIEINNFEDIQNKIQKIKSIQKKEKKSHALGNK